MHPTLLFDRLLVKYIYQELAWFYTPNLPHSLGISGIQLARSLQKNSPLGGSASGSSREPTQM
jgi:hypothetical protein